MQLLSLFYRRPKEVDPKVYRQQRDDSVGKSDESVKSGDTGASYGIPDALSFDRIVNGGTCPPLAIRDFMNYLIYVERSAENLQFYLWFKSYERRFAESKVCDVSLAPEWTQAMEDEVVARVRKEQVDKMKKDPPAVAALFRGTDFDKQNGANPFTSPIASPIASPITTPPQSANGAASDNHLRATMSLDAITCCGISNIQSNSNASSRTQVADTFHAAGVSLPFSIQPFHQEVNRVVTSYLMEEAPRQLNMAAWEQKATVQALAYTTHPTAFRVLFKSVDSTLRLQSHPNFIRWSICNGNQPRVHFANYLGGALVVLGFAGAIVLSLSSAARGYRVLPLLACALGVSTLVAAWKGMCIVLHGLHHRHLRPWELFAQDGEQYGVRRMQSFGYGNSYEDEPWVVKYEKRNMLRKIFDREIWIQEPGLRQVQDTIFCQALLAGLAFCVVFMPLFIALPAGHFF